jgi:hypothetical protein
MEKIGGHLILKRSFLLMGFIFSLISTGVARYTPGLGDLSCGQEGQKRCSVVSKEFWLNGSGGCDRGLTVRKGKCHQKKRNRLKNEDHRWVSETIKFQREMQADLPLNQISFLWLHNAFNNRSDGYTFPNHNYSVTDLLDLGARVFEVDTHLIGKRIRLCHGKYSHAGCSLLDRLYFNIIEELNIWIRKEENKNEVVILKIQDQSDGRHDLVELPLMHHLKDLILLSSDHKGKHEYPTLNEMRKVGKRLVILGGPFPYSVAKIGKRTAIKNFDSRLCQFTNDEGNEVLWTHDPTFEGGKSKEWQSVYWDGTVYPFFWDGEKETGKITPELVKKIVECNITGLEIDMMSPEHAYNFIWTWEENEPKNWNKEKRCAFITKNGRWKSGSCESKRSFACQSEKNPGIWAVTRYQGSFEEGKEACQRERFQFKFSHPQNGWENARLYKNHAREAWINVKNEIN